MQQMNQVDFLTKFQHPIMINQLPDFPLKKVRRKAAVLCPVVCRDELTVLFTQRSAHLRHHPGQICFPGGGYEQSDLSLKHTALRETEEEIGLARKHTRIIGEMQKFRTVSGYEVTPYVALVNPEFDLQVDSNEVSHVFEVPLSYLVDQSNHIQEPVRRNGIDYSIYFIPWQDTYIWGATAAFIRILSNHLNA